MLYTSNVRCFLLSLVMFVVLSAALLGAGAWYVLYRYPTLVEAGRAVLPFVTGALESVQKVASEMNEPWLRGVAAGELWPPAMHDPRLSACLNGGGFFDHATNGTSDTCLCNTEESGWNGIACQMCTGDHACGGRCDTSYGVYRRKEFECDVKDQDIRELVGTKLSLQCQDTGEVAPAALDESESPIRHVPPPSVFGGSLHSDRIFRCTMQTWRLPDDPVDGFEDVWQFDRPTQIMACELTYCTQHSVNAGRQVRYDCARSNCTCVSGATPSSDFSPTRCNTYVLAVLEHMKGAASVRCDVDDHECVMTQAEFPAEIPLQCRGAECLPDADTQTPPVPRAYVSVDRMQLISELVLLASIPSMMGVLLLCGCFLCCQNYLHRAAVVRQERMFQEWTDGNSMSISLSTYRLCYDVPEEGLRSRLARLRHAVRSLLLVRLLLCDPCRERRQRKLHFLRLADDMHDSEHSDQASREHGRGGVLLPPVPQPLPGYKRILDDITLDVPIGQLTAIIGPIGSGKTTLLDLLANRSKSGQVLGEVTVSGASRDPLTFHRFIGYVYREDDVVEGLTVKELLCYSAEMRLSRVVLNKAAIGQRVQSVMEQLGLTALQDRVVKQIGSAPSKFELSAGQVKTVCIAMELVVEPKILFLDEPTSNLDATSARDLLAALHDLAINRNKTIVMVIHNASHALLDEHVDYVLGMRKGRVVVKGSPSDVLMRFYSEAIFRDMFVAGSGRGKDTRMPQELVVRKNPFDTVLDILNLKTTDEVELRERAQLVLKAHNKSGAAAAAAAEPGEEQEQDPYADATDETDVPVEYIVDHEYGSDSEEEEEEEEELGEIAEALHSNDASGLGAGTVAALAKNAIMRAVPYTPEGVRRKQQSAGSGGVPPGNLEVAEVMHMADMYSETAALGDDAAFLNMRMQSDPMRFVTPYATSHLEQLDALLRREGQVLRLPWGPALLTCCAGLLLGLLYNDLALDLAGSQSRLGLLLVLCYAIAVQSLPATYTFLHRRELYARELSAGCYRPSAYYVVMTVYHVMLPVLVECAPMILIAYGMAGLRDAWFGFVMLRQFCTLMTFAFACNLLCAIVGIVSKSVRGAISLAVVALMGPSLLAGFLINLNRLPHSLQWLRYLSMWNYTYELLAINEFHDVLVYINPDNLPAYHTKGDEVLKLFGFDANRVGVLALITLCWPLLFAMLGLVFHGRFIRERK
jgi:ABC-type multidrug transport system ATPase subunit